MSNENLLNETHNPALTSWVNSANQTNTDFPIQNLPFGIFKIIPGFKPELDKLLCILILSADTPEYFLAIPYNVSPCFTV